MSVPGNQNAARPRIWQAAIKQALERRLPLDEKKKAIDELADKLVGLAMDGDMAAMKEVGDRLEGKPAQAITGESGGEPLVVKIVKFADVV